MPPRPDLTQLGSTGLNRMGGRIYEEWLPELQGDRWRRTLRQMVDNDPVIGAILFAVEMLVRQVTWRVEPASEEKVDVDLAAFVEGALFRDMENSWQDTLSEILTMLPWGYAPMETVYKIRGGESRDPTHSSQFSDGRVGWRGWSIRAQETLFRWQFDDDGRVTAMEQMAPPDFQLRTIPLSKMLLFRTSTRKGSPEGRSILRNAYTSWYFKTAIQKIEAIGIERDLAGLPVAWVPPELLSSTPTAEDAAVLAVVKDLVTNIRRDEQEGIVFPLAYDEGGHKLYDLTLLSTGGTRQFDTDKVVARYDHRIAVTVLADFILLGQQAVGSYALSSSKTNLFGVALGAWLDLIAGEVNAPDGGIPRLMRLNGFKAERWPQLVHGDIESVDLVELGDYIQKLSGIKMQLFPNRNLESYLLSAANLPEMSDEEREEAEAQRVAMAALAQRAPAADPERQNGQVAEVA